MGGRRTTLNPGTGRTSSRRTFTPNLSHPNGHYDELTGWRNGLSRLIREYVRDCLDCDNNPQPPVPPGAYDAVRSVNDLPPPETSWRTRAMSSVPGSDAAWGYAQVSVGGVAVVAGGAAAIMSGNPELIPAIIRAVSSAPTTSAASSAPIIIPAF